LSLAGRSSVGASAPAETLALQGGKKAVTYPEDKHHDAARWPLYGPEDEKAVLEVLRKPSYQPLDDLEADWKEFYQVPYVKAQCNGTGALACLFFALDLPPGSEVMVPSYTFFATIVPMRLSGLVPVFVDIDPRTLNFDLEDARKRLTPRTRAILPVHWFGNPCDMDHISDFAKEHGLIVLEDCAHAHCTSLKGKLMGTWGEMSIFSFQTTKPLPALEGGMGMYMKAEHYERACCFGHYDQPKHFPENSPYRKYAGTGLGVKFRMHPLSAALARVQLRRLKKRNESGVKQVRSLNDRLIQLPGLHDQKSRPDAQRLYYDANVLFIDPAAAGMSRATAVKALRAEGVHASEFVYPLQHKMAIYREKQWWHHPPVIPELPGSEQANATAIMLPYFTSDVPELVEQYVKAFEKVWAHRQALAKL
jgi:dTDP-4-amino-4,6-dideoxygalactose transaminase